MSCVIVRIVRIFASIYVYHVRFCTRTYLFEHVKSFVVHFPTIFYKAICNPQISCCHFFLQLRDIVVDIRRYVLTLGGTIGALNQGDSGREREISETPPRAHGLSMLSWPVLLTGSRRQAHGLGDTNDY